MEFKAVIYEPGATIDHVYFPESGIISLLSQVDKNASLELGLVGNEGFAGLPVFLGATASQYHAVVQGSGHALRISAVDFLEECEGNKKLSVAIRRYIHSFITQISQAAACNRFHSIEERTARWLLMTQDRMQADEFQITHEFLSNMLGVRREAVSRAAADLQRRGIVSYSRGKMTVIDREELEKTACRCYDLIKNAPVGA